MSDTQYDAKTGFGRVWRFCIALPLVLWLAGCATLNPAPSDYELRERTTRYIRAAARFPDDPAVRAQAMESISDVLGTDGSLLLREGLVDEHPVVRFASCMALGQLADRDARAAVQSLVNDPDGSVRVAAYFALERMGDLSHRMTWRDALVRNEDPVVRRNAALALGRLHNKDVIPLLNKVMADDDDDGVRIQALEALAFLGEPYAINRFIHDAYGGIGFKQPFALLTLGHVTGEQALGALRTRLEGAPYLEAKLAAARGLGMHGYHDGYELALKSLTWNKPKEGLRDDPPATQIMRVRSMAAMALGDIGKREALGPLYHRMETDTDPRVQLAAATAVLMILDKSPAELLSVGR